MRNNFPVVSVVGIRRGVQSLAGIQIARVRPDNVFERVAGLQPPYNMIIFGNSHIFWLFLVFYSSLSTKSSGRRMNSCYGRNAWGRRRFGTND